jgi:hemerythrin-like metal-binding protein
MSEDIKKDDEVEHKAISDQISFIRAELEQQPCDANLVYEGLRKLLDLTKAHFRHEEDHMIIDGYPGLILHKRDHDYLAKGLSDFTASVVDGTIYLSPSVGEELQSWLRLHIKRFDEAYEKYAATKD